MTEPVCAQISGCGSDEVSRARPCGGGIRRAVAVLLKERDEPGNVQIQDGWLQSPPALRQEPRGVDSKVHSFDEAWGSREDLFAERQPMRRGVISKVVSSYGSEWGRIRPVGLEVECFFNRASLLHPGDFAGLEPGQAVEFDDEPDRVHGTRAVRVAMVSAGVSESAGIGQ